VKALRDSAECRLTYCPHGEGKAALKRTQSKPVLERAFRLARVRVLPHPYPLPLGEGTGETAALEFCRAHRQTPACIFAANGRMVLPLPAGEGRGEISPKNSRIEPLNPILRKHLHDREQQFPVHGGGRVHLSGNYF
jgi:hypothetical protein